MAIPGRTQTFTQPLTRPKALPPEANPWWWHPSRPGILEGPRWMVKKLEELDETLALTENKYTGLYQVWARKPNFQTKICWGWMLLFTVHPSELQDDGAAVCARLYSASAKRWGNGKKYFEAIEREMAREKEAAEKADFQDTMDRSMDVFYHSQIKNIGLGSKFATYHS